MTLTVTGQVSYNKPKQDNSMNPNMRTVGNQSARGMTCIEN